jgi:arylformamidase
MSFCPIGNTLMVQSQVTDNPPQVHAIHINMYEMAFGTDPRVWAEASPVNHVTPGKGTPPFLVCISGQIPEWTETGRQFANKLFAAGIPVRLIAALDKTHNSIVEDVGTPFDPVTGDILEFIQTIMSPARPSLLARR